AFAQANPPLISFWDGLTAGLGYMWVLVVVALFRELLGFGTILGFRVMPENFVNWTIMVMPPSAFFVLAILIWVIRGAQLRISTKNAQNAQTGGANK
ncbi:MAG TPA: Rnf-Nqr domain containing protein, partial [Fervidobacterium sp.]|nr:Rnf-Nqr domain containing protein [Fervidobacterium sp.]